MFIKTHDTYLTTTAAAFYDTTNTNKQRIKTKNKKKPSKLEPDFLTISKTNHQLNYIIIKHFILY